MKKSILVLFVALLVSCGGKDRGEDVGRIVDFSQESTIPVSDVFSVSYVKLATNDSCLLGGSNQCVDTGESYLLVDQMRNRAVYAFRHDGSFAGQVGNRGNGPGEYAMPIECFMDVKGGCIYVGDVGQQKLLSYSLDGFRYLQEFSLPHYNGGMESLPDGGFAWYSYMDSSGTSSHIHLFDASCRE